MIPSRTNLVAENANERDVLGGAEGEVDTGSIERGTVGWDDGSDFIDQGGAGNDGTTLVKVQLYRGRDPATPLKPNVGQGHKIQAQVSGLGGFNVIPRAGTQVLVAIPAGMRETPGAALIIGTYPTSPTSQFAPDRQVLDAGAQTHLVIKAKSVTLQSESSPAQYISVGQPRAGGNPGCYMTDETGSGITVQSGAVGIFSANGGTAKAVIQLTSSATGGEVDVTAANTIAGPSGAKWTGGNASYYGVNWFGTHSAFYFGNITNNPVAPYTSPPFPIFYDNNGVPTLSMILFTQA